MSIYMLKPEEKMNPLSTRSLILSILFLATTVLGLSMAKARTGAQCKEFIRNTLTNQAGHSFSSPQAVMTDAQRIALEPFYPVSSERPHGPRSVPFSQLQLQEDMNAVARSYVRSVRQVLNQCGQHCHGLSGPQPRTFFDCREAGKNSANDYHALIRNNDLMADSAEPVDFDIPEAPEAQETSTVVAATTTPAETSTTSAESNQECHMQCRLNERLRRLGYVQETLPAVIIEPVDDYQSDNGLETVEIIN
jgi:hypothetical protein